MHYAEFSKLNSVILGVFSVSGAINFLSVAKFPAFTEANGKLPRTLLALNKGACRLKLKQALNRFNYRGCLHGNVGMVTLL